MFDDLEKMGKNVQSDDCCIFEMKFLFFERFEFWGYIEVKLF
jgi:hypothetical protein